MCFVKTTYKDNIDGSDRIAQNHTILMARDFSTQTVEKSIYGIDVSSDQIAGYNAYQISGKHSFQYSKDFSEQHALSSSVQITGNNSVQIANGSDMIQVCGKNCKQECCNNSCVKADIGTVQMVKYGNNIITRTISEYEAFKVIHNRLKFHNSFRNLN